MSAYEALAERIKNVEPLKMTEIFVDEDKPFLQYMRPGHTINGVVILHLDSLLELAVFTAP